MTGKFLAPLFLLACPLDELGFDTGRLHGPKELDLRLSGGR